MRAVYDRNGNVLYDEADAALDEFEDGLQEYCENHEDWPDSEDEWDQFVEDHREEYAEWASEERAQLEMDRWVSWYYRIGRFQ